MSSTTDVAGPLTLPEPEPLAPGGPCSPGGPFGPLPKGTHCVELLSLYLKNERPLSLSNHKLLSGAPTGGVVPTNTDMPGGPCGPGGPPSGPIGPCGPTGPGTVLSAPFGPAGPIGPCTPCGPC